MDYQPTMDQMNEGSSGKTWYVIILVVLIAVFALWYFSSNTAVAPVVEQPQASALDQTQIPALTGGNTTADIAADLNQVPNTASALDADAAASAQAVQGF